MQVYEVRISHGARVDMAELRKFLKAMMTVEGAFPFMSKRVYISADYSEADGDRDVVDVLHQWAKDNYHVIEFADTARVVSGSVSNNSDCRPCDFPSLIQISYLLENQRGFKKRGDSPTTIPQQFQLL